MAHNEELAARFNRFRSALNVREGDLVFITHPYSANLPKLAPRAYGPYRVSRVKLDQVGNVMYAECMCKVRGKDEEEPRVFPRRRLRPVKALLPEVDWNEFRVNAELDDAPDFNGDDFPDFATTALAALSEQNRSD